MLLDRGVKINAQGRNYNKALQMISEDHKRVVRYL
jgi:hypothetical protein